MASLSFVSVTSKVSSSSADIFSRIRPRAGVRTTVALATRPLEPHKTLEVVGGDHFPPLETLSRPYNPFPVIGSNRHVETIFAAFFRSLPDVKYRRECIRMADDGTVSLDWSVDDGDQRIRFDAPVLILLPGLTGGSGDAYVKHMVVRAKKNGWHTVVFNSRGCADSPVTTSQCRLLCEHPIVWTLNPRNLCYAFCPASFTEDIRQVVHHVGRCFPQSRLYAVGWSLGANILVRYLGQKSDTCPLAGAASLCNPFDLVIFDEDFRKGFNVIYDTALAEALKSILKKHAMLFENIGGEYNIQFASTAKSVRDFNGGLTRVSFGYKSVDDYFFDACGSRSVKLVCTPLLCIRAANDPIAPSRGIPREDIQVMVFPWCRMKVKNLHCLFVVTPKGGHLGWVAGDEAPFGCPWIDPVVMDFFDQIQKKTASTSLRKLDG